MLVEPIDRPRPKIEAPAAVEPTTKAVEPSKAPGSDASPEKRQEATVDTELLQDVLEVAQKHFQSLSVGLEFSVHSKTGRMKVTVLDKETGDTIREIPPDEILNMMARIDEMMGVVFDQKA